MPRPDSVRRPACSPVPFRHPYYESPRAAQRRQFNEEIAAYLAHCDARRARLSRVRVLEVVL